MLTVSARPNQPLQERPRILAFLCLGMQFLRGIKGRAKPGSCGDYQGLN